MSYQDTLVNLRHQDILLKPCIEEDLTRKVKNYSASTFQTGIPKIKRKRKKYLTNFKIHHTATLKANDKIVSPDKYVSKCNLSNESLSFTYSDNDCQTSINTSCEENWKHEIETDISPSKSEYNINVNPSSLKVDTIYHISKKCVNNIFSAFEDLDDEHHSELESLVLSNTVSETLELKKEKVSCINIYEMKNGKILILKDRNPVHIHGGFVLSILFGSLQLLGCNLTPSSDEIEVYSLRGFSYLSIQNIHQGNYSVSEHAIKNKLRKRGVSKSDMVNIFSEMKTNYTILACTSLNSLKLQYIEKHLSQKLLPVTEDNFPLVIKDDISNLNILIHNSQWDDIATKINNTSKLMICGGKGVGKSTLLRYIINKLLENISKILVIDLDPGQTEFTIPGCISAILLSKPIFGPNFTHLHKPERCIFIENIDVTLEPDIYVNSVIELLKQCEDLCGIPTLINYMGHTHSYGLNIASSIITYMAPTILLQINSSQQTKNFTKNLTPDTVMQHCDMFGSASARNLFYEIIIVDSMSDGLSSWQAQGRTIREMCILSYFSDVLDTSLMLTSTNVPLYKISLKDIKLVNSRSRTCSNKSAVFNANLVGLCTPTHTENIYNCHGWGIVRGIDEEKLVLITPVSEDILDIITHLTVGSVTLPPSMLMYEDTNIGLIPYVSIGCISTFNYIPKRSYLPRKNY